MEIVNTTMSYREQAARFSLITTVLIYAAFVVASRIGLLAFGTAEASAWLVSAVALQSAIMIAIQIATALRMQPEPKDERDVAIELRAYRAAYLVLAVLVMMGAIALSWTIGPREALQRPILLGHLLLMCFVASEVTKFGTQSLLYRKGR